VSTDSSASSNTGATPANTGKDVSLGPACLVVFVFFLVLLCVAVAVMSFMLTGNQGKRAAYALREMLIPWVDASALAKTDRDVIIDDLQQLAGRMEREELTSRQLTRLGIRLSDSVVLQWGVVEDTVRAAKSSQGLTETEKLDFQHTCDRWLRSASEGKLTMTEMEFAFQGVATKEPKSGRLTIRRDGNKGPSDEALREFHRRVSAIVEKHAVSDEPMDKSVSQVFKGIIEDGLKEPAR